MKEKKHTPGKQYDKYFWKFVCVQLPDGLSPWHVLAGILLFNNFHTLYEPAIPFIAPPFALTFCSLADFSVYTSSSFLSRSFSRVNTSVWAELLLEAAVTLLWATWHWADTYLQRERTSKFITMKGLCGAVSLITVHLTLKLNSTASSICWDYLWCCE